MHAPDLRQLLHGQQTFLLARSRRSSEAQVSARTLSPTSGGSSFDRREGVSTKAAHNAQVRETDAAIPGAGEEIATLPDLDRSYLTQPKGLRLRARQAPNVARRILRHPGWVSETFRNVIRRRGGAGSSFSLETYRGAVLAEADAVAAVTGETPEHYTLVCQEFDSQGGDSALYGARPELERIAFGIVRLTTPATVVETGVAQGVTTRAILSAMDDNGVGRLYSVDLPVLFADEDDFVGRLVPEELRTRWDLELGPSRQLLPSLVSRAAPLDIFLHDADHTYPSQMEEYRTAWPALRSGGILISDDVGNPAFVDFAEEVNGDRSSLPAGGAERGGAPAETVI